MAQTIDIKAVRKLSVKQRLKLVDAIWESFVDEDSDVPLPDATISEIRRRREEMRKHPERAISHEEMMKRLRSMR